MEAEKFDVSTQTEYTGPWAAFLVVLNQPTVRQLLTTRLGRKRSYVRMDLHGAHLAGADLREASLKEANCAGTDFTGADLTGATIESWNIDTATKLKAAH